MKEDSFPVKIFYYLVYLVALAGASEALPFVIGVGAGFLIGVLIGVSL